MRLSSYINYIKPDIYWEITKAEAFAFYDSLDIEKKTNRLSLPDLLRSEILLKEKMDGKLVGLIGITRSKGFPMLFIFVKSEYQNIKVGTKLIKRLDAIINKQYFIVILKVLKSNRNAIKLYSKNGYRVFHHDPLNYYMAKSSSQFYLYLLLAISKFILIFNSIFPNFKMKRLSQN